MKNIYTSSVEKISGCFKPSKVKKILVAAFIVILSVEVIGTFVNSGNRKFFVETPKAKGKDVIFNSSIIESYYQQLSSTPFNYLTSFAKKKSTSTYRVFLIGEASLSGWPYSVEHSMQRKLDKLFGSFLKDENIEVITISTAGFNSSQALDIIPQVFELNPDLIILYAGHNEFYGYNGYTEISPKSKSYLIGLTQTIFKKAGLVNTVKYDKGFDDLEILLPFNSEEQIITAAQKEYAVIRGQFQSNINKIISICKENKISLALTALSDNYLLPPIGVQSRKDDVSADIIFNNARMALIRDGNPNKAIQLFKKSKDADALRLRIPEDFIQDLVQASAQNEVTIANVNAEFVRHSPDAIPGNDLFLDYIHPNCDGLNIIASVYAKVILEKFIEKTKSKNELKPLLHNAVVSRNDSLLAKERIERSLALLKQFNNSQQLNELVLK